MAQVQQQREIVKKSSYSDFIREAERIVQLKEGYEGKLLNVSLENLGGLEDVIAQAEIMKSELEYVFTWDEISEMGSMIDGMRTAQQGLRSLSAFDNGAVIGINAFMTKRLNDFKKIMYRFLAAWNRALENHNLILQTNAQKGEIEGLYTSYNIAPWYLNSYGIPTSPQMETLCRWLYVRAKNNWDNVIIVEGKAGVGKSSFVSSALTTLAGMFNQQIDIATYKALMFKESRQYCQNLIKTCPQNTQMWYDEAGNQFNKRSWWVSDQSDLINDLQLSRFSGFTLWLLWGDYDLLDSDLRNYRATALISIKERGQAILRQFNENPHATKAVSDNPKLKRKIVTSQHEAHKLLEQDFLSKLVIPYYEIKGTPQADKFWNDYTMRKTSAKKAGSGIFNEQHKPNADDYYRDFLVALDNDFLVPGNKINDDQLSRYSSSVNQYLTMIKLAQRIAKACGTTSNRIFIMDSQDSSKGSILLDEILVAYVKRLKAEKKGLEQQKKEGITS